LNLTNDKNSPFPLSHDRYNRLDINESFTVYLPYKKTQPFVFTDSTYNKSRHAFLYVDNLEQLSVEIFYSFENFEDIDRLIDIADFSKLESKINMILLESGNSETFYYTKRKGINKLLRCYKSKVIGEKHFPFWTLELENHNKYMPIEKRVINGKTIESYFHIYISDNKLYHSYSLNDDKPFQITKYHVGDDFFYEKDYLIPLIKNKRSEIYKPTFIRTKNNKLVDYEYFIDGVDYTSKARILLNELNILDPNSHSFTEKEKVYLKQELIK